MHPNDDQVDSILHINLNEYLLMSLDVRVLVIVQEPGLNMIKLFGFFLFYGNNKLDY